MHLQKDPEKSCTSMYFGTVCSVKLKTHSQQNHHAENVIELKVFTDSRDRTFNRVISDISVVLKETTITISDSIGAVSPVESETVRVVSLSATKKKRGNTI